MASAKEAAAAEREEAERARASAWAAKRRAKLEELRASTPPQ